MQNVIILEYTVRNMGLEDLEDVHLAFFADADIVAQGESGDAGSLDDGTYFDAERKMMVTYDDYRDADGPGPGVFAVKALRPPIMWQNTEFSYRNFERSSGGDPETNADKFLVISSGDLDGPSRQLGDWRMLMGWGAANGSLTLAPTEIMSFSVAMFAAADTNDAKEIADRFLGDFSYLDAPNRPSIASEFTLHQNYPNPFNPTTTIGFSLAKAMTVRLTVYDGTGREVGTLFDDRAEAGTHTVLFDGTAFASGTYFYSLKSGRSYCAKKMILIK